MKKAVAGRRVPRKIGGDDEPATAQEAGDAPKPVLKAPIFKPRKSTNLRTSIGVSSAEDDVSDAAGVITPKRSTVSKIAVQRNASKRAANLPIRRQSEDDGDEGGPSYSAASIQQLKASTPSTPRDLATLEASEIRDVEQSTQALDLSSKFGSSLARYQQQQASSAIPSAAEIAEKKSRRARLAKEQAAEEYISLDPDDPSLDNDAEEDDPNVMRDDRGRLVLKENDKWDQAESRLVRDDEDIMEGFEDFTGEDGRVQLGRNAEKEAARERRTDMAAQIAQAEGSGSESDDSDASERDRNAAFEAAQTRHGTYAATNATPSDPYEHLRPKTPAVISPLPTLDGVLDRLRRQLTFMQQGRTRKLQEMETLQREKIRLGEEELRIQKALRETAEKFQHLRTEKGLAAAQAPAVNAPAGLLPAPAPAALLEQLGSEEVSEDEESDAIADAEVKDGEGAVDGKGDGYAGMDEVGHSGHNFTGMAAMPGQGIESGLGMAKRHDPEDDW